MQSKSLINRYNSKIDLTKIINFLFFLVPPKALISPNVSVEKEIGHSIRLTCHVHGFPKPDVVWRKDGTMIPKGHYTFLDTEVEDEIRKSSYLEIPTTLRNDTGNYSCFLKNIAGSDEAYVVVTILGKLTKYFFKRDISYYSHNRREYLFRVSKWSGWRRDNFYR